MSIENGYVAAMFHDVKKRLLIKDPKKGNYGMWGGLHMILDNLTTQGDCGDLPTKKVELENDEQILLIKLHHGDFDETLPEIANMDTTTVISLMAADRMHKALYFGDSEDSETSTKEPEVARQFPFYYPFYGEPVAWLPTDSKSFEQEKPPQFNVENIQNDLRLENARKKFVCFLDDIHYERNQAANKRQFLTARMIVEMQKELFSDFPDTTYLPITSLAFHHQLVTALLFFIRKRLENFTFSSQCGEVEVPLYLNTIISPPEKLTNRLRDTATVRKISHRLQQSLHDYLNDEYLADVQRFDFWHPDYNPFFFYNKDASILLSAESDQQQIGKICGDVSRETESVITMESIKIDGKIQITLKDESHKDKKIENLKLADIHIKSQAFLDSPSTGKSFWYAANPAPVTGEQESAEAHCYQCNKTVDDVEKELKRDISTGDLLCECCHALRRGYRFCINCDLHFKQQQQGNKEKCPHCDHLVDFHRTTDLLQGRGRGTSRQVHRVSYILIKTNCTHDAIKLEGDQLMAQFREHRGRFEQPNNPQNLRKNLAQTSTTKFGVFEYLQAALNMNQFQNHLYGLLSGTLKWLQEQQKRQRKNVGYQIYPSDLTDEALSQYFLYRSPMLTLLVIPEEALRYFYDKLRPRLNDLHIAHRLRMVTCQNNHPVWMVLRALGLQEENSFPFDELKEKSEELNEKLIPNLRTTKLESDAKDVLDKSKELLDEYRKQVYCLPEDLKLNSMELKLTIMRSGVERTFEGEQADFLLTWQPSANVPTQIGHFAEFASRILADPDVPENAFHHNLFLELDSRTRETRKELIPKDVVGDLRKQLLNPNLTSKATPGFIREIAAYQRLSPYEQHRRQTKGRSRKYVQSR
ncbi:hypothetical protein H8E77_20690 [bacterium]|nr:hypothetical protein [bacterium]